MHLFGIIGDGLARAKALNILQHNGFYSCFKCLQSGDREEGSNSTKFEYDPTAQTRTHAIYLDQVKHAEIIKKDYQGIKGPTNFSKYVEFPRGEIVDPLHLIFEGTFKSMFQDWFSSSNHSKAYYLGTVNHQTNINKTLRNVKFPSDYPRIQREIQRFSYCTANEYKHFMLNASLYVFENLLPYKYFEHLCLYVCYVRLLSQPSISKADIIHASEIINEFVQQFSTLYGRDRMTHNLHLHLHLPLQVFSFGGLDMLNAFPLEGYFKICRQMFYGTKTICETINRNLAIKHWLVFSNLTEIENPRLAALHNLIQTGRFRKETKLLDPVLKTINLLQDISPQAVLSLLNGRDTPIMTGTKALINGIGELQYINIIQILQKINNFLLLSLQQFKC